ncbi:MAG: hypothetical protein E7065_06490 [Lentimicrobiaceae bacterium]|nr:hypothetical protein [Lentimicrobiaceae bacterium]
MITNSLIELLQDNECVIVPDFGAFISKRHSATIDYANHRFTPPYKEIVFNNKLKNDDGLLVDFMIEKESLTKEDALAKIRSFVNQSEAILDVNSELVLEGIGKIRKFGDDYILTSKTETNLLGDSFGLTEFNVQPVFRTETYQIIKERIVVEQKEKNTEYTVAVENVDDTPEVVKTRKPGIVRTFAVATLAFLLLFAFNWKTEQTGSNFASWNPFLYSSPNEFLINFMEPENVLESENLKISEPEKGSEPRAMSNETFLESENLKVSEPENVLESHHYFIVGGSFQTLDRAEFCLKDIRNQGFENASLLEKNDKGYIRVYYESFVEKSDALIRLDVIKNDFNESAWLLFQK